VHAATATTKTTIQRQRHLQLKERKQ